MNVSCGGPVPSTTVGMSILSFRNNMLILCEFLSIFVGLETPYLIVALVVCADFCNMEKIRLVYIELVAVESD